MNLWNDEESLLKEIAKTNIDFLTTYSNKFKQSNDYSVSVSCFLLALQIRPLAKLFLPTVDDTMDDDGPLNQTNGFILDTIDAANKSIPIGFQFNNEICQKLVQEFCLCVEMFQDSLFLLTCSHITVLQECLHYDNQDSLLKVIKTLSKLCRDADSGIYDDLFSPEENPSIISMLEHILVNTTNQDLFDDLIRFFIVTKTDCRARKVIDPDTRAYIYCKKLTQGKQYDFDLISRMMTVYNDDVLHSLVLAFNELNSTDDFMNNVMNKLSFDRREIISKIIKLISGHINSDSEVVARAARLFSLVCELSRPEEDKRIFSKLPETLTLWLPNAKALWSMLEFINQYEDTVLMRNIFKSFPRLGSKLVNVLRQAFSKHHDALLLRKIMVTFKKLASVVLHELFQFLNEMYQELYDEMLQVETLEILGNDALSSHESSILKLSIMIESKLYTGWVDVFKSEALVNISAKKVADIDEPAFPLFARFHVTILLEMWTQHMNQLDVPKQVTVAHNMDFVISAGKILINKLLQLMHRRDFNLLQARDTSSSLVRLLCCFHVPPMKLKNGRIFLVNHPEFTAVQMDQLVEFVEFYVFKVNPIVYEGTSLESVNQVYIQRSLLASLTDLIKAHTLLPNMLSMCKLIRHFRCDCKFHDQLEMILQTYMNQEILIQSTVFVFIDLTANNDSSKFAEFATAFTNFLPSSRFDSSSFLFTACEKILTKLLNSNENKAPNGDINRLENVASLKLFFDAMPHELRFKL